MMTEIFRGLLDILYKHHDLLHKDLISHIRRFDRKPKDMEESEIKVGVFGFWRLLLEQLVNFYLWVVHGLGLILLFAIGLIGFPIRLLIGSIELMLTTNKNLYATYTFQEPSVAPIPANDNKPEEHKDDKQVVRRVVYEEAKVNKG